MNHMINKHIIRSHISETKTREVIRLFSSDIEAVKIAELTGVSRNTTNRLLKALRIRISVICERGPILLLPEDRGKQLIKDNPGFPIAL